MLEMSQAQKATLETREDQWMSCASATDEDALCDGVHVGGEI